MHPRALAAAPARRVPVAPGARPVMAAAGRRVAMVVAPAAPGVTTAATLQGVRQAPMPGRTAAMTTGGRAAPAGKTRATTAALLTTPILTSNAAQLGPLGAARDGASARALRVRRFR